MIVCVVPEGPNAQKREFRANGPVPSIGAMISVDGEGPWEVREVHFAYEHDPGDRGPLQPLVTLYVEPMLRSGRPWGSWPLLRSADA